MRSFSALITYSAPWPPRKHAPWLALRANRQATSRASSRGPAVQIIPRAFTHGSRRWAGRGQDRMWKWLVVLFAGSYAQALATRRSLKRTMLHSGKLDLREAAPVVTWLVKRG